MFFKTFKMLIKILLKILIINLVWNINFINSALVFDDLCLAKNYPDLLESMMDFSDKNSMSLKVLNSNNILSPEDTMYCKMLNNHTIIDTGINSLQVYTNSSSKPIYTFFNASKFNGCFTFKIKAEKKAWISLSTGPTSSNAMYEIVLNKEDINFESGIRVRIASQRLDKFLKIEKNVGHLNEKEFKTFWIKWGGQNEEIEIGAGNEVKGFLKYKAPAKLLSINNIGIMTWENLGNWIILDDQKCPGYKPKPVLKMTETKCWKIPLHLQDKPLLKSLITDQNDLLQNLNKVLENLKSELTKESAKLNYEDAKSYMDQARQNDRHIKLYGNPNDSKYKDYNDKGIYEKIKSNYLKCTVQLSNQDKDSNILPLFELSLKELKSKIDVIESLPSPKLEDVTDLKTHQIVLNSMIKNVLVVNDTINLIPKLNSINEEIQNVLDKINIDPSPNDIDSIPLIESFKSELENLNHKIADFKKNKNPKIEHIRLLVNNEGILRSLLNGINKLNLENIPDLNSELNSTNVKIYDALTTLLIPTIKLELKSLDEDIKDAKQNSFITTKNVVALHVKKNLIENKLLDWDNIKLLTSVWPKLKLMDLHKEITDLDNQIDKLPSGNNNIPLIKSFKSQLETLNHKIADFKKNKNPKIEDIRLLVNNQEILGSLLNDINKLNLEIIPDLNSELNSTNVKIYDTLTTSLIPQIQLELKSLDDDIKEAKQNNFLTTENFIALHVKKNLIKKKLLDWDNIKDSGSLWPKSKFMDLNMEVVDLGNQIDKLSPKNELAVDLTNYIPTLLKLYSHKFNEDIEKFKQTTSPTIQDIIQLQKKQDLIQLLVTDLDDLNEINSDGKNFDKNLLSEINNSVSKVKHLVEGKSSANDISNLLNKVIIFMADEIKLKTNKIGKINNIISEKEMRTISIDINNNIDNIKNVKTALILINEKIPDLILSDTYTVDLDINKCVKKIKTTMYDKETTGYSPISSDQREIFEPISNVLIHYRDNLEKLNNDFNSIKNPSMQAADLIFGKAQVIKNNVNNLVNEMNNVIKKNPGFNLTPDLQYNVDKIEKIELEIMDKIHYIASDSKSTPIMDLLKIQKDKLITLKKIAIDIKEPSAADIEILQIKFNILDKINDELIEASNEDSLTNKNISRIKDSIKDLSIDLHTKIDNFLNKGHENAEKLMKSQLELIYTIKSNFEDFNQLRRFNKNHLQRQLEHLEKFTEQIQGYDTKIKAFSSIENDKIKNLLDSYNKNKRYLYSINLINDFRKKILEKYNEITILDDYQEIITPDSLNYQYFKIANRTGQRMEFRLLAEHNANIALVSGLRKNDFAVEFFIGDQFNEKSIIRRNHLKNIAENSTINVLDSLIVRGFWISWADEVMQIGKEDEVEPFLEYESDYGMPQLDSVKYLGLGTTHGVTGKWYFKKDFKLQKVDGSSKNLEYSEEDYVYDRADARIGHGVVIN